MTDKSTYTGYPEKEAREYDEKRFSDLSGKVFNSLEMNQVNRFFSYFNEEDFVLEIGCGTGRFMKMGEKQGLSMVGLDMSSSMIERAQKKTTDSTLFCISDGAQLPIDSNSFDGVYSVRTLNQVSTTEHALSIVLEMIRVCKPGGIIMVEFVNEKGIFKRKQESCTYNTYQEIESIIQSSGGEILHREGILFFSQTILEWMPDIALNPFIRIDQMLGRKFPNRSTRSYLFGKVSE